MQQTATPKKAPKKFFYGWIIVLCCTLLMAVGTGIFVNCVGIFVKPVCEDLGFERGTFTLYTTITSVLSMLAMLVFGELYRKKPRRIRLYIAIGGLTGCLVFFGYSLSSKLWHFYTLSAIYGCVATTLAGISVTTLVNNWFVDKRGLATGLAFAGSGVSAAIMTPVLTTVVTDYGWRMGYRTMSLVSFIILIPAMLLIRLEPSDKGLLPYGVTPHPSEEDKRSIPVIEQTGLTRAQAVKTSSFYFQSIGIFCLSLAGMGISNHAISYFTDIGYSPLTASTAMSLVMTIMIGAKILLGAVFDKIGSVRSAILTGLCMIASTLSIRFAGAGAFMPYVFSVCFGFGYSTLTVPYSYLIGQNFGTREFSSIYSLICTLGSLGGGIAATLTGMLYDRLGSYYPVWTIYFVLACLALTFLFLASKTAQDRGYQYR
ncbi:MAG TPA: MFS transporter [Candidatus Galloscillospira excrementipullorum]|nr:MFS transporter [Candidatus Galloscillospira excrementipullorum]